MFSTCWFLFSFSEHFAKLPKMFTLSSSTRTTPDHHQYINRLRVVAYSHPMCELGISNVACLEKRQCHSRKFIAGDQRDYGVQNFTKKNSVGSQTTVSIAKWKIGVVVSYFYPSTGDGGAQQFHQDLPSINKMSSFWCNYGNY